MSDPIDSLKALMKELPPFKGAFAQIESLEQQREEWRAMKRALEQELAKAGAFPLAHFYSPVPSLDEVASRAATTFDTRRRELPGVDLRDEEQLALLEKLAPFYADQPFAPTKSPDLRYFFENPAFGYADGIFLHAMIRHLRPKRIVEVGSGYSSALILDTNERFFQGAIDCTFIEPYPEVLRSLLRPSDAKVRLIEKKVQDVPLETFTALEANDILFVDSSHVSKVGSDVNHLFFEVLPRLRAGVRVHFHDIFYPFEMPEDWVKKGIFWNEAYLLRAFLSFNEKFRIALFADYLAKHHRPLLEERWPLSLKNSGGSIWLERV